MPKESKLLHNSARYSASLMKDGSLIIQSHARGTGIRVLPGVNAEIWAAEIATSLDDSERDHMCKGALMQHQ